MRCLWGISNCISYPALNHGPRVTERKIIAPASQRESGLENKPTNNGSFPSWHLHPELRLFERDY
jgi:hypothetical protein